MAKTCEGGIRPNLAEGTVGCLLKDVSSFVPVFCIYPQGTRKGHACPSQYKPFDMFEGWQVDRIIGRHGVSSRQ